MGRWISFTHSQRLLVPFAVPQLCDVWRRPALTLLTWTFGTREKAALFNVRAVRGATDISEGVTKAFFPNGLARLSLTDVHDTACLWFIENCSPAATVRLCNCPSSRENERLGRMLENKSMPSCLNLSARASGGIYPIGEGVLRHKPRVPVHLVVGSPFGRRGPDIRAYVQQHPTSPEVSTRPLQEGPDDDFNNRIAWMRGPCSRSSESMVRNGPFIQSCSTATSIRLAKPLNRNVQPML
ncbi:hypothetical protein HPB51_028312 [Rhipicephalus microplus]|uniref:Uncharacterized protein n=1 Tax=Rhipicephalus microplus TaxID=6941 RepID=A0A9J6CX86_RHIMP|nr:hypothetical protein HPB51_028312 [Rhipicephalus microplus]